MSLMSVETDERIRELADPFLRGEMSVVELIFAFRAAVREVTRTRPLQGKEVALFGALELWESSGRPAGTAGDGG